MNTVATQLIDESNDSFYTLDSRWITENARRFCASFPGTVLYALKANPLPGVLEALNAGGIRHFDVASLSEVATVYDTLDDPVQYLMNPVKSRHCVREAYHRYGVRAFVIDSPQELTKLRDLLPEDDRTLTIYIRYASSESSAVYDLRGKFGASPELAVELIRQVAASTHWTLGLSFHVGSQAIQSGPYLTALRDAEAIVRAAGSPVRVLDIGGGFPGAYLNSEGNTEALIGTVCDYIQSSAALKDLELICEAGRGLVYGGMSLFARVLSRREHSVFCGAGIFGGLLSAQQWLQFPARTWRDGVPYTAASIDTFQLFGPTCDSMDRLAFPYELAADLKEGDWLEFQSTGAYSVSLRTPFNGFYTDRIISINA
ncbi:alanine racemase [Pseudomonas viridiflava]|uniref:alanine racemase n=1 Tax=Pseudomonas viridiflava TaxID=33069 RepID=UPI0018E616ED|nr:alanine racemase [Pseudomonas viridiflava]MBI6705405.1 alanine racemase [Pseudomonas viridiflava]MBI6725374.1 alanine racemase [Pseudomonas viridiflava]